MRQLSIKISLIIILCSLAAVSGAIDWPVWPDSTIHRIGNGYAQYQYYPGYAEPFMHTGIDILVPIGTPVYSVKTGWVKAILTSSGDMHWRIVIGDTPGIYSECEGYMYSHLEQSSMTGEAGLSVGDYVEEGQFIGRIVHYTWIDDTTIVFDHLHFSKVHDYQWDNFSTWEYSANPFDSLENIYDPDPPVFEDAISGQLFGFCYNLVPLYYDPGDTLSGEVDIICHVYDYINHYDWKLNPNQIEYRFEGPTTSDWIHSICFSTPLGAYGGPTQLAVNIVYQNDAVCQSLADFVDREYYFNITNHDGDSLIEASDDNYAWNTYEYLNGEYTVHVRATDPAGNSTIASLGGVVIENYFSLNGTIGLSDLPNDKSGTFITSFSTGDHDTTDIYGDFTIPMISGGPHQIIIWHDGYWPIDTILMIDGNTTLNTTLQYLTFTCGDANSDDVVNEDDILFLHDMLFNDGPAPDPYQAGNANLCEGINIADLAYLVSYHYQGGAEPCEAYGLCEIPTGNNAVTLGCPLEIQLPGEDSIGIPIYITNDFTIGGLTLGFEYSSYDAYVSSVSFEGSVLQGLFEGPWSQIWPESNRLLIYSYDLGTGLEPQTDGLLATIWLQTPGETDQVIDIDSIFIAPGSEFMFASIEGPAAYPAWNDCGTQDIIILSPDYLCGDANGDEENNVGDAVMVINYVFNGGAAPDPVCEGDCNGDNECNVGDAVYMINYVFNSGAEPEQTCCQ
jgi:hypothetical protein